MSGEDRKPIQQCWSRKTLTRRASLRRQREMCCSVPYDQAPDDHGCDRRAGDAGPLPFRPAGNAEKQDALRDRKAGGGGIWSFAHASEDNAFGASIGKSLKHSATWASPQRKGALHHRCWVHLRSSRRSLPSAPRQSVCGKSRRQSRMCRCVADVEAQTSPRRASFASHANKQPADNAPMPGAQEGKPITQGVRRSARSHGGRRLLQRPVGTALFLGLPLGRQAIALAPLELVGVAETGRARMACEYQLGFG
jgi:hypothetical protein